MNEPQLFFKICEVQNASRRFRLCLRRVRSPPTTDYEAILINSYGLDEEESLKVQNHCSETLKRVEKVHNSLIWDVLVSVVGVDRRQTLKKGAKVDLELDLDVHQTNGEFDVDEPHCWNHESLVMNVDAEMEATQLVFDSFVVLFALDSIDKADVIANCITEHLRDTRKQSLVDTTNTSGTSRASRPTPRPSSGGYCVVLCYSLLESVSSDALLGSCLNRGVDIAEKKHMLMASLATSPRLHSPPTAEKIRKKLKQLPDGLSPTMVGLVSRMSDLMKVNESENGAMLSQFIELLCENRDKADVEHLLAFLNRSDGNQETTINTSNKTENKDKKSDDNDMSKSSCLPKPMARVVAVRTNNNDMSKSVDHSATPNRRPRPTTATNSRLCKTSKTSTSSRTTPTSKASPRLSSSSMASSSSSRTASPSSSKERITRDHLRRINGRSQK